MNIVDRAERIRGGLTGLEEVVQVCQGVLRACGTGAAFLWRPKVARVNPLSQIHLAVAVVERYEDSHHTMHLFVSKVP